MKKRLILLLVFVGALARAFDLECDAEIYAESAESDFAADDTSEDQDGQSEAAHLPHATWPDPVPDWVRIIPCDVLKLNTRDNGPPILRPPIPA